MAERALYLARMITTRLVDLHRANSADVSGERGTVALSSHDVVAKILAIEEGITDHGTVEMVAAAAPDLPAREELNDRDVARYADFLRERLRLS